MPMGQAINLEITHNSIGFTAAGGTAKRSLTVNGTGDVTLTGTSSSFTYTFPGATTTLVGTNTTQTLSNKTFEKTTLTPTTGNAALIFSSSGTVGSPSNGDLWWDGTNLLFKDTASTVKRIAKKRIVMVLCAGFTPAGTGADVAELVVPYHGDGTTAITYNVRRIQFRVQTAGGAPQVTVERSTASTAFSAATVGSVTLGSGAHEGAQTSSFTTSTLSSGDKVRMNVNTLATATNWTVQLELEEA